MTASKFIDAFGGTSKVAVFLRIKGPSVTRWRRLASAREIPLQRLMRLAPEAEARGIVSRKELFPHDWHLIWPELAEKDAANA